MSVQVVALAEGSVDDPLDDEGALKEQLERLPVICRFQYAPLARYVAQLLDAPIFSRQRFSNFFLFYDHMWKLRAYSRERERES